MELTEPHRRLWPDEVQTSTADAFQVLGHPEKSQMLLPARPLKATSRSLIRYHGGMGFGTRFARRGAAILARLGILGLVVGDRRFVDFGDVDDAGSLRSILSNAVGEEDFTVAISFGPPRANQKPIIRIMRPDGHTLAFAKVGWDDLTRQLVEAEIEALSSESVHALPSVVAPRILYQGEWDLNRIAVFQAVLGAPGRVQPRSDQFLAVAQCWPTSSGRLNESSFFARLVADLANIEGANSVAATQVTDAIDSIYGAHRLDLGGWHGDWTPWNNARGSDGRIVLWDWERAGGEVPIGFDSIHYRFQPYSLRRDLPLAQLLRLSVPSQDSAFGGNDADTLGYLYLATIAARHLQPGGEAGPTTQYGRFLHELAASLKNDSDRAGFRMEGR